ncbi:GNAT family N-acetyltransferase [Oceanobacillus iheyensis]|uniref:Diamine N-acetyltransferase (Spermine:spermidine acetyltransferase) n=1 Tax=Oceanobacillus iheyensis (strain DSM 14371 / CIP 107618 / JCM 11309 / KCTC 3954 / HTE831) TaxID=221109 RepID=Q8CXG0_OCEIH|nr:GNAT family N-acetyltransferase [Oceanobacillus iheyensis]BAC13679.1 diamine N-acetyltransferase (spermine:spermidine acetyltransferase) [Oceanobacillus iheyensis HTE831]
MNVYIEEVTKENWREIATLTVASHQQHLVESVSYCLAESFIEQYTISLGLYDDDTPIGYAMVGFHSQEKQSAWFDRFMIAAEHQGKGYAHQYIPLILDYIKMKYQVKSIKLSIIPTNDVAKLLYEKYGFVLTGETDPEGELIMELFVEDSGY